MFGIFDGEGPWGWGKLEQRGCFVDLLSRLAEQEGMKWSEILADRKRTHSVEKHRLVPQALKRLREINQDDVDELFRFRFTGTQRLWGIRDRQLFKLLWWDPEHKVCPSHKS